VVVLQHQQDVEVWSLVLWAVMVASDDERYPDRSHPIGSDRLCPARNATHPSWAVVKWNAARYRVNKCPKLPWNKDF
jgi:hypothetical protein